MHIIPKFANAIPGKDKCSRSNSSGCSGYGTNGVRLAKSMMIAPWAYHLNNNNIIIPTLAVFLPHPLHVNRKVNLLCTRKKQNRTNQFNSRPNQWMWRVPRNLATVFQVARKCTTYYKHAAAVPPAPPSHPSIHPRRTDWLTCREEEAATNCNSFLWITEQSVPLKSS